MDYTEYYEKYKKEVEQLSIALYQANDNLLCCNQIIEVYGEFAEGFMITAFESMEKILLLNLATILDSDSKTANLKRIIESFEKNETLFNEKLQLQNINQYMSKYGISKTLFSGLNEALMHHNYTQGKNYEVLKLCINKAKNLFSETSTFFNTIKNIKVHRDKRIAHYDKSYIKDKEKIYEDFQLEVDNIKKLIHEIHDILSNILILIGKTSYSIKSLYTENLKSLVK